MTLQELPVRVIRLLDPPPKKVDRSARAQARREYKYKWRAEHYEEVKARRREAYHAKKAAKSC